MFYKYSIRTVIHDSRTNKQGKTLILIRVTINRKTKYFQTGYEIEPNKFLKASGTVAPRYTGGQLINGKILKQIQEIETFFIEPENRDFEKLAVFLAGEEKTSFKLYADKFIFNHAKKYSAGYIRGLKTSANMFNAFAPNVYLQDITKNLLIEYQNHLATSIRANTIHNRFKFLKLVLRQANEEGVFINSLYDFTVKKEKTQREFLQPSEVEALKNYLLNEAHPLQGRRVCLWFLISVETGLRYGDLKKNIESIVISGKQPENNILFQYTNKTKTANPIPLTSAAAYYLEFLKQPQYAVKPYSNEKCNEYLKAIAIVTGISKKLTMHVARHTCATTLLQEGVPIEAIKQMLGHNSIQTTMIYAQITNNFLTGEISKLNERRKNKESLDS